MISGIYMLSMLCLAAGLTTLVLLNFFMWRDDFKTHRSLFENTASPPYLFPLTISILKKFIFVFSIISTTNATRKFRC